MTPYSWRLAFPNTASVSARPRPSRPGIRPWLAAGLLLLGLVTAACHAAEPAPASDLPPPAVLAAPTTALDTAVSRAPWELPKPGKCEEIVTRVVVQLMTRSHYERRPVDTTLSQQLYDAYFDRLDHDRQFFVASDIGDFALHRDDLYLDLQQGKLEFPFAVYERFIQRVRERLEFIRRTVAQPLDFTADEDMVLDRSKGPWCADQTALDEVWRLRIKNQLLINVLMDQEQKKKEAAKKSGEAPRPEAGDTTEPKLEKPSRRSGDETFVSQKTPQERVVQFYDRFLKVLEENESMDILEMYLNAYTQLYDPHSTYMAPASEEDFDIQMKLSLQGIGAVLTTEEGYVKVLEVVPGGPADLDDRLQAGDRIIAVAQEGKEKDPVDVINMPLNKVVRMIRGQKGTRVTLRVLPADKGPSALPVLIDIVRNEVKLTESEAKGEIRPMPGAGTDGAKLQVINLPSFYSDFEGRRTGNKDYKSATRDVRNLLEEGRKQGVQGVILDLRSDGGGSLEEAVTLAGLFFSKGPVVQVRNSSREIKIQADTDAETVYSGPLVVMVNRFSASASEIVAAALQDHHRAILVGDASTHGKGTVQTVYHLDSVTRNASDLQGRKPGSLKFTMAKFYRVNGGSTQQKGVTPDIIFPAFADHLEVSELSLPNCMPWDEIVPLNIAPCVPDVQALVPTLREQSRQRVEKHAALQELIKSIARYGELRKAKTVTLNQAKRETLQTEEDSFSKLIRENSSSRKRPKKAAPSEEDATPGPDLILEETLNILADLVRTQQAGMETAATTPAGENTAPEARVKPATPAGDAGSTK